MATANGAYVNGTDSGGGTNGFSSSNRHATSSSPEANGHLLPHKRRGNGHEENGHSANTHRSAVNDTRIDSMKGKTGKKKSRKSKPLHKTNTEKDDSSSATDGGSENTDETVTRKCSVCEADVMDTDSHGDRTVCKACIMPHGTSSAIAKKQQKSSWFEQYLNKTLPCWFFEPEYMVHGKPKTDPNSVHRHMDSLFSTSSGFTNYRGLLNLALLLLVLSNARLFLENLIKYGILINPFVWIEWFLQDPYNWPSLLLTMSISVFPLVAFCLERAMSKEWLSDRAGAILHGINLTALLVYPATVVYIQHPNPVCSVFSLTAATVSFLKLVSYAHVNYWCRNNLRHNTPSRYSKRRKSHSISENTGQNHTETENNSKKGVTTRKTYPENLNLHDLTYFMLAPTLCYELNFPRSARIRKRFLVKRLVELLFLVSLQLGLVQQWIVPTVNNSLKPLTDLDFFKVIERLLKLSVPNHFIWLIFFYCYFHSLLNVIAELLMFGDREFYRDWWNAENLSQFWQHWNIPVHRWATRHVYKPLLVRGYSKIIASTLVFMVSAFFHE
ncbi:hypothetical protein BaRGS_00025691, partial [Batillaria attramentaria]